MTDEEFQALRESYRRAGDAWHNQLKTVRRAQEQADRLLAEFQDLELQATNELQRRWTEAPRKGSTAPML